MLFIGISFNAVSVMPISTTSGEEYDWPMHGYDPACTSYSRALDIDNNNKVDIRDLVIIAKNFGKT